ncbi:class II aldolase/adducin family protein [Pseudomonas sp. 5P_3.1_Bac2]|uniref:class II aldolase/adducin family protein n=1 Tax=Pseudomonas sp. 5P_3.1_Bac2 TaxID=2971617 RepID=UPI0021C980E8|nr:class II aldolase/adducin family protein [Pseudomonas sp. 5P_3.1_Bac2]MCU1718191.1 class II aldolase/adducin family protein [Pseudomonas sp. 5P_3.1_Bac2]
MSTQINPPLLAQLEQAKRDFAKAFTVLKDSGTLSASQTLQAYIRVPASEWVIALHAPSPWAQEPSIGAVVASYSGEVVLDQSQPGSAVLSGSQAGGNGRRYAAIFQARSDIDLVIHVHTPSLGAWAGAHRSLPIRYAASQRLTLTRELPVYIDRRQPEPAFILQSLTRDPHLPAILEANGGSTFWGRDLLQLAKLILLIEEGAHFQRLAEGLGGSLEFGPGVLEQQWKMTGLWAQGQQLLAAQE